VNADALTLVAVTWIGASALMGALWLVQRARRDATIVDAGWGAALGAAAVLHAIASPDASAHRRVLVAAMASIWALRLTMHLAKHRVARRVEDARYAALRRKWGERAQSRFFVLFEGQALLVALLAVTYLAAIRAPSEGFGAREIAALAIWAVALAGETVADRQLASFRADPANRGRTCRRGLWRYSRHPNYFFEWLTWCAYVPLAVGTAWGPLAFVAPSAMLLLLLFVTGVPPAEARALESRGDDYRRYQRETSVFVPWWPKDSA
jgi:steroid 5-alpha reductase family enzyme